MFGHQDNNNSPQTGVASGYGGEPQADAMLPPTTATTYAPTEPSPSYNSYGNSSASNPAPAEDTGAGNFMTGDPQPSASGTPAPATDVPSAPAPTASDGSSDDLINLKQSALQQLTPLLGQLEQTPEEKFRTTMMMIQAADNKDLLKSAYEAAQAIPDEKARAQALLDVVNEINYFTQQQHHDTTT